MCRRSITATIITLNEEDMIVDCVRAVQKVCDEVVVLDSNSLDKTRVLAEQAGAQVYIQEYLGDGLQKAKAAEYATHDWILSIDADERPDTDALAFLRDVDLSDENIAYTFRRKNFVGKRQIVASGFYPDHVIRLYNRKHSGYNLVHRHAHVQSKAVVKTRAHLLHYTYKDYSDWIKRINSLTSHDAFGLYKEKKKSVSPGAHATAAFIRKYIFKGGLFQGRDGFTVAITTAFASYMKYLKLIELHRKDQDSPE